MNNKKIAFVVGNGTSRKSIEITGLLNKGTVYGCNALYRELTPDHLIAVDVKMIKEIINSKYNLTSSVWTNSNSYTKTQKFLNIFNPSLGWSSGPSALNLSVEHGHTEIYILGFDYVGTGSHNEKVNNVYAGTINYKKQDDRATYYGNWVKQTATVISKNPHIKFYRVITNELNYIPDQFRNLKNLINITDKQLTGTFDI